MPAAISHHVQNDAPRSSRKLISWKAISSYLECDERTAKRWEHERRMPVHRTPGLKRSRVFAYAGELDAWLQPHQETHPSIAGAPPAVAEQPGLHSLSAAASSDAEEATIQAGGRFRSAQQRWRAWVIGGIGAALAVVAGTALLVQARPHVAALNHPAISSDSVSRNVPAEAAQLYLRGRYFWNLRTADSLAKAIDAYEQAIVKDPAYAEAYAGIAESYDLLPQFAQADLGESLTRAKNAADRAIALNPKLASAHRAKAFALFFWDWDIAASDAEFQRALALDPDSPETHQWYASTLDGRLAGAECLKQIGEARSLNPASPAIAADAALFEFDYGDFDSAMKALREVEQTQPTLATPAQFFSAIDFALGDFPAYIADLHRIAAVTHSPLDEAFAASVARGWAQGGRKGLMEARFSAYKRAFEQGKEPGFLTGETLILLGRSKQALPYFRAALKNRVMTVMTMEDCDWAKGLAGDPEYAALFAEIRGQMRGGYPAHLAVMPIPFRLPLQK
jgi:tetratricopeptide (TPR) repeat protein